jgi:hypothetical protein
VHKYLLKRTFFCPAAYNQTPTFAALTQIICAVHWASVVYLQHLFISKVLTVSQVVLEFSNQDDLMLLLTFAKRLNAKVVSVKQSGTKTPTSQSAFVQKLTLMQQAANDPLFLEDVEEVMADFAHADNDEL